MLGDETMPHSTLGSMQHLDTQYERLLIFMCVPLLLHPSVVCQSSCLSYFPPSLFLCSSLSTPYEILLCNPTILEPATGEATALWRQAGLGCTHTATV